MGEMAREREPAGSDEIAGVCGEFLDPDDCGEIALMTPEEALETAISWLEQSDTFQGNPIEYFIEKGLLEA